MVFKIALPLLLLCSCATTVKPLDIKHEVKYAISYCLSSAYLESQFSKDAGYVSGAYIQKGSYGLHVYESIRGFVDLYIAKKYNSKHNRNLTIMQCIDLNDSIELVEIIHTSLKNG